MHLQLSTDRSHDQAMELDESPDELYKLKFTTIFFLGVAIRSESRLQFAEKILMPLIKTANGSLSYSQWLVTSFAKKHAIDEFFASNWSTESCRIVNSLFIAAFKKVHSEDVENVSSFGLEMAKYKSGSPEDGVQFLKDSTSDPEINVPLTIRCVYNFMVVLLSKVEDSQDMASLSTFLFLGVLNDFADIHQEYRRIMINFRVQNV